MRRARQLILSLAVLSLFVGLLLSCEDTTFQSSVPTYPVRLSIDTKVGPFVHFLPTAQNTYIVVNKDGYFYNGEKVLPLSAMDAYGYGGVVVYVSLNGYDAYDLACPSCAAHGIRQACEVNGIFATCPHCGEEYDLGSGYAMPQHSIAHEALRRLNIMQSDGKLTITQKQ